jgi:AbrB family looped-hinge helix DNA binding protein
MVMAAVTSKGQVTIPVAVREALGLREGSRIDFRVAGPERIEGWVRPNRIGELFGAVPHGGARLTVTELDEAIGRAAAARDRGAMP